MVTKVLYNKVLHLPSGQTFRSLPCTHSEEAEEELKAYTKEMVRSISDNGLSILTIGDSMLPLQVLKDCVFQVITEIIYEHE